MKYDQNTVRRGRGQPVESAAGRFGPSSRDARLQRVGDRGDSGAGDLPTEKRSLKALDPDGFGAPARVWWAAPSIVKKLCYNNTQDKHGS